MNSCQLSFSMKDDLQDKLLKLHQEVNKIVQSIGDDANCLLCQVKNIKELILELDSIITFYHFESSLLPNVEGLDEISKALSKLSEQRHGALIAIEKNDSLGPLIEKCNGTGIPIEARVTASLLQTIFFPGNIMHDGAVIIRKGQIVSAGCIFPLSEKKSTKEGQKIGTRHRAALGLSERCDALVMVVSEETGRVSFALNGVLYPIQLKLCENLKEQGIVTIPQNKA